MAVSSASHGNDGNKTPFHVVLIPKWNPLFGALMKSFNTRGFDCKSESFIGLIYVVEISDVLSAHISKGDFREKSLSFMTSIGKNEVSFQSTFHSPNKCPLMKVSLPYWLTYPRAAICLENEELRKFVLLEREVGKVQIISQMTKPHFTITSNQPNDSSEVQRVATEIQRCFVEAIGDETIRRTLEEYWKDHTSFKYCERILVPKQNSIEKVRGLLKLFMLNPKGGFWLDRFMNDNSCSVFISGNCDNILVRGNDDNDVKKATSILKIRLGQLHNLLLNPKYDDN